VSDWEYDGKASNESCPCADKPLEAMVLRGVPLGIAEQETSIRKLEVEAPVTRRRELEFRETSQVQRIADWDVVEKFRN